MLKKREKKILKFFLYNLERSFSVYEVFEYLHLNDRINVNTLDSYISSINTICRKLHREKLIYKSADRYKMKKVQGIIVDMHNPEYNIFAIQMDY